ncbi:MAG: transglutaminase domain-containing protein [Chrysiogenetes bacterium]|nr:transglutaminase domain-containing protein [Chrysiogenetes bacterium]
MTRIFKLTIVIVWLGAIGWLAAKTDWSDKDVRAGGEAGDLLALEIKELDPGAAGYEEAWFGVYLRDVKVGYTRSAFEVYEGGVLFADEVRWDMQVMGAKRQILMKQRGELDKNHSLSRMHFRLETEGSTLEAAARHRGKLLDAVIVTAGGEQNIQLDVPEQLTTPAAVYLTLREKGLKVGAEYRFDIFDPFVQQSSVMTVNVEGTEDLDIGGKTRTLYRVSQNMLGNTSTMWLDEKARVWREQTAEGLEMRRESAEQAGKDIRGGDLDIGELFAVRVVGKLENIPSLREVTYRIEGLGDGFDDLSGLRQSATSLESGVRLTLAREEVPATGSYELPYTGSEYAGFLKAEPFVPVGHPKLTEQARKIIGDEKDPVAAARALTTWVFDNLAKQNVVGVPNALEALETRSGDCNEHATLLVALARSVGLPARVAVGLVHLQGSFYYHAWTEFYVGQWVSADATVDQMPADVTRIRLAQGNMGEQAKLTSLLGKLQITIEEAR